ncbi:LacI family DNA-binding transcriptional regulator [Phytoactinopolyspora mesophila]|uniref:Substrate-binding domain-containing protein n=1 Tax=Phytoactinopolyspora mesophila TaxID=2650750 RepID=A0A7K3M1A7_9ACTN|nr:LacI family DNA-binding transcriptional regulator [Phytoactinopolyspora mesophila]NDL57064.1 substrate-binding domain-containing protein [Phytoactinopolyspora mesophila]
MGALPPRDPSDNAVLSPDGNTDGRKVTISVIAQEAGVSVPTVSRVVNGRSDVAPDTRRRVEQLLNRYGYNRRALRTQAKPSARLIDLVFNDLDSPWAVEIIRGIEDVAHNAGLGTVVSATHREPVAARQWLQNLRARASDGVILVNSDLDSPVQEELRRLNVPMVVVDPVGGSPRNTPTIGATNWAGGLSAVEHLTELGHRRIGFISGLRQMLCSRARMDGYRAGLEAAGITPDDALIREGDFYHESGFHGGRALLELDDPPTAIFASSDTMAFGVYEAVRQRGWRVPDDVSVVGFDDLPETRWSSPPLTTVRQPLAEMGALAARSLLRLAAGDTIESPRVELATDLTVRESTVPPRRSSG